MLQVTIPAVDLFDEQKNEFITIKQRVLQLEHSLVSLSKWESKWKKPFLGSEEKTSEETLDYIRCMTITQNVDPSVYDHIPGSIIEQISEYIDDSMTATWFHEKDDKKPGKKETITAEIIYYWMIALNIPESYQKWHLNRLITLVRVCNIKNAPPKKKSNKRDILARNRALNAARRQSMNTKG
jgi:hypothetical protein